VGEKRGEGEYPHKANVKRDIHTLDRERLKRSGNTLTDFLLYNFAYKHVARSAWGFINI
jgi:hypothetical protein